jgi:hypothetical protein
VYAARHLAAIDFVDAAFLAVVAAIGRVERAIESDGQDLLGTVGIRGCGVLLIRHAFPAVPPIAGRAANA